MLKVEIKSEEMNEKVVRPTNGKDPFTVYEQAGKIALNDEVRKLTISQFEKSPYKPGVYIVAPASYYVDQFGGLKMGRLVLTPA